MGKGNGVRDGDLPRCEANRAQNVDFRRVVGDENGEVRNDGEGGDDRGDDRDHQEEVGQRIHGPLQCLMLTRKTTLCLVFGNDAAHNHILVARSEVVHVLVRLLHPNGAVLVGRLDVDAIHHELAMISHHFPNLAELLELLARSESVAGVGGEVREGRREGIERTGLKRERRSYNHRREVKGWSGWYSSSKCRASVLDRMDVKNASCMFVGTIA